MTQFQWALAFAQIAGGLGLFLHGLEFSARAFRKGLGAAAKDLMTLICQRKGYAFSFGLVLALLTQSTTAATSFAVGLVDLGMIPFAGSLLVMMGASVGTTFIIFLLSMNMTVWSPLGLALGVALAKTGRSRAVKAGYLIQGVSLVLMGMELIGMGVAPLQQAGVFEHFLMFGAGRPVLMFVIALLLTALVQSSVPVLGLAVTLASAGAFPAEAVLAVVLGSRVGNSALVLITGLGARKNARALALATVIFRVAGVLIVLPIAGSLMRFLAGHVAGVASQVSWAQFAVGWLNVAVVLPFTWLLGAAAQRLAGSEEDFGTPKLIDSSNGPLPALGIPLLAREMTRLAGFVDEIVFLCTTPVQPQYRNRLNALASGVPELFSACQNYLSALDSDNEDPQLRREHVALAYSLTALGDLCRALIDDFVPLSPSLIAAGTAETRSGELWRQLPDRMIELIRNALAAFALDEGAMFRATMESKDEYRRLTLALRTQMAGETSRDGKNFNGEQVLLACDRIARACAELARGGAVKARLRTSDDAAALTADF